VIVRSGGRSSTCAAGCWRFIKQVPSCLAAAAVWLASCGHEPAGPPQATQRFRFEDTSAASGLERVTWAGRPGKDHLLDSAGYGVALLDYDKDGHLDAFVVNGWLLDGERVVERGRHALYRGHGDGTFEDVTQAAGVSGNGDWGCGVAVADFDLDGWSDILVTSFGSISLFRNLGNGTFEDVAGPLDLVSPAWNTGAAFLDADGDGDLDLYVAAYIDCTLEEVLAAQRTLDWKGVAKVAFGPFGLEGAADHYFRREPDGRYVEAAEACGLRDKALGFGFAVRALDYDADGDPDLFVANDSDPNYLYRNEGGVFTEVGVWSGVALDGNGAAQACMGAAVGDVDGDGSTDLFVTNFADDASTLYRAMPGGLFRDVTRASGLHDATFGPLSWGTALADLDQDGDLDLVQVNGHIYPQVDEHPELGQRYLQPAQLFENKGDGHFAEVSAEAGPDFAKARAARGLAVGDVDGDGDLDLLMSQLDGPPVLLRNDGADGAWLQVACEDPAGRTTIGARLEILAGGKRQARDISSSDSYLSCNDPRLHFGLGAATRVDELRVHWPDRSETVLENVPIRQLITVRKGQ
jgi:enediyne biosynthesis protein E4